MTTSSAHHQEAFLSLGCFSEGHIHCPWFVCTITTQHPSQSNRCGKAAQKIMQGGGGHDTTCKSGLQFVKKKKTLPPTEFELPPACCLLYSLLVLVLVLFSCHCFSHTHMHKSMRGLRVHGGAPNAKQRQGASRPFAKSRSTPVQRVGSAKALSACSWPLVLPPSHAISTLTSHRHHLCVHHEMDILRLLYQHLKMCHGWACVAGPSAVACCLRWLI